MRGVLTPLILYIALTVVAFRASADERSDSAQQAKALPELVVVSEQPSVIAPQTLKGEQLEGLSAHNVADALRYFSGVQIKDYGGVGGVKTIDIRSMGSTHTGVFYDGIQLGNAQNGQIDLGKYSLDNIDGISLYNGQKSEIFQPARDFASSSAIYIQSRRPRFQHGKRYSLNATFRAGSFGLVNPSARFDYKISNNVSASVSAEYTFATGRYKFRYKKVFSDGTTAWDTTATRRNGDIHALRLEGGLYGSIPEGSWTVKAYYYDSDKGIPGAIVNNVWKNSQRQWDRNFFLQGRISRQQSERYEWMVNAKYARDRMRYLNPDTTLMYIDNKFLQQEVYLSTTHKFSILPVWDVSASADWQWNNLDASLTGFSYPVRNTILGSVATALDIGQFRAQAAVLLNSVNDRTKLTGTGGSVTRQSRSIFKATPSAYVSWRPDFFNQFTLRGFAKRIFRMPTFNDLYYTDIGNSNLKPEIADQYDIGFQYLLPQPEKLLSNLGLNFDTYFNRVSDRIIAVPKGTGQYRWMMMNIGKVRIFGIDITADMALSLPCDIKVNARLAYTYQRARDYSDPTDCTDAAGTYRRQIAYIPVHSGSVAAGAQWHRLGLNYSFIYVGERYQNSSNIPVNYVQPWYTHDLSVHYSQPLGITTLKATLEVNNLLNQQYEVIQNYPMPGRNFKIILSLDL